MRDAGNQVIETERLLLRPFEEKDAEDMLRNWAGDPDMQNEYGEPVYTDITQVSELLRMYTDEIEYCIGKSFWGHGYAGEALSAVIRYTFSFTAFTRLEAYHRAANGKSGRVLEKSQMHITDTVQRFVREGKVPEGEICYCIEKNEYNN